MSSPILRFLIVALLALPAMARAETADDVNKTLVIEFYKMAFVDHQPSNAAKRYLASSYIQHNPRVPDGPEVFAAFFEKFFADNPSASSSIKRVIAQGDLVMIHSHSKRAETDRGMAIVDIFRVEAGKIVEHWDVMQSVPETTVSGHGMF